MSIIEKYKQSMLSELGKLANRIDQWTNIEDYLFGYIEEKDIDFDFDVFLPTKGFNLQRDFVWTLEQKQELIRSILLRKTIGNFTIIQLRTDNGKIFQVIDGKQRLSTIIDFLQNKFSVNLLGNEYFYRDLDGGRNEFSRLLNIKANILYSYPKEAGEEITDSQKIALFKMLNFAGTPQEKEHLEKLTS